MFACFHGYVNQKKSLNLLIEPEFQTKFHSNLHSSRNERHWHKSHSPHFDWDLSIGNSSMVMSLVFLVDKFTIFSWIWRISFTCYKGITIVDIFSPCECSLQLLYVRRRQKEVCRTCTTSQNKSHQNYLIINLSMIVIQVWIYIYLKRRFVI